MNTKMMEQFHEMDIAMLSSIEGGKNIIGKLMFSKVVVLLLVAGG